MDHKTAINHCEALRAQAGNADRFKVVADISTGREGHYGIESDDVQYWEYEDFPELWQDLIRAHRADRGFVDIRVSRYELCLLINELSSELAAARQIGCSDRYIAEIELLSKRLARQFIK